MEEGGAHALRSILVRTALFWVVGLSGCHSDPSQSGLPQATAGTPASAAGEQHPQAVDASPGPEAAGVLGTVPQRPDARTDPVDLGDAGPASPDANPARPGEVVEVEQALSGLRPELIDYLWNNLDGDRFERWASDAHLSFEWLRTPASAGDLGAEPGASYRSTQRIGSRTHELVVTYIEPVETLDPAVASGVVSAEVTVDAEGPYRWDVAYRLEGQRTLITQRHELPSGSDLEAWARHLETRMASLPDFLGEWFETDFLEGELLDRGTSTISADFATGTFDIIVEQRIRRLTPQMLDWWWDNIGDTYRYQRWHPTAHTSFEWIVAPTTTTDLAYEPGAVQRVVETIGNSASLDIAWLEPTDVPVGLVHDHFVYGSTLLTGTPFGGFLLHEYDAHPEGGIRMKSTFRLPSLAGMPFAEALADHCQQEMQFLQYFLPGLFAVEFTQ